MAPQRQGTARKRDRRALLIRCNPLGQQFVAAAHDGIDVLRRMRNGTGTRRRQIAPHPETQPLYRVKRVGFGTIDCRAALPQLACWFSTSVSPTTARKGSRASSKSLAWNQKAIAWRNANMDVDTRAIGCMVPTSSLRTRIGRPWRSPLVGWARRGWLRAHRRRTLQSFCRTSYRGR